MLVARERPRKEIKTQWVARPIGEGAWQTCYWTGGIVVGAESCRPLASGRLLGGFLSRQNCSRRSERVAFGGGQSGAAGGPVCGN